MSWAYELEEEFNKNYYKKLMAFLTTQYELKQCLPYSENVFKAYEKTPHYSVRVVVIGQAPYAQAGIGNGLAYSVHSSLMEDNYPPELKNIFRAVKVDTGIENVKGDLTNWALQGVFMLNRLLTCEPGKPASHAGQGWEDFTTATIRTILSRNKPVVFMLWGKEAQALKPLITASKFKKSALILETSHPKEPHAGFMFSRQFSQANDFLEASGYAPISWKTY